MKTIALILITYILFSFKLAGQNLVPNPSFEILSNCPAGPCKIDFAEPWFQPHFMYGNYTSSSDLFNTCDTIFNVGVPLNFGGYQIPHNGNGYAGIIVHTDSFTDYREYIEVLLTDTLSFGKQYCVSFYVSLGGESPFAISNLGAWFSLDSTLQTINIPYAINVLPQVENPISNIISDTTNWVLVSGTFFASGGEHYMTIGNFHNPANTNTQAIPGTSGYYSYYFIDDVSVTDCTPSNIDETYRNNQFELFPNPSTGKFSIISKQRPNENIDLNIYNLFGTLVYHVKMNAKLSEIDLRNLTKGVYVLQLVLNNHMIETKKLLLE